MANEGLKIYVEDGVLHISIGVEMLAHSIKYGQQFRGKRIWADDAQKLAEDIVQELCREEEDGTQMVHRMLDQAAWDAYENGSEAFPECTHPSANWARVQGGYFLKCNDCGSLLDSDT